MPLVRFERPTVACDRPGCGCCWRRESNQPAGSTPLDGERRGGEVGDGDVVPGLAGSVGNFPWALHVGIATRPARLRAALS